MNFYAEDIIFIMGLANQCF